MSFAFKSSASTALLSKRCCRITRVRPGCVSGRFCCTQSTSGICICWRCEVTSDTTAPVSRGKSPPNNSLASKGVSSCCLMRGPWGSDDRPSTSCCTSRVDSGVEANRRTSTAPASPAASANSSATKYRLSSWRSAAVPRNVSSSRTARGSRTSSPPNTSMRWPARSRNRLASGPARSRCSAAMIGSTLPSAPRGGSWRRNRSAITALSGMGSAAVKRRGASSTAGLRGPSKGSRPVSTFHAASCASVRAVPGAGAARALAGGRDMLLRLPVSSTRAAGCSKGSAPELARAGAARRGMTFMQRMTLSSGAESDQRSMASPLTLSAHPLFRDAPAHTLATLEERGRRVTYAAGRRILREGQPAQSAYVLLSGGVRIWHAGPGGRQIEVRLMSAPAFFGECEALLRLPWGESVEAILPSEVLVFSTELLEWFMASSPVFSTNLVLDLAHRLLITSEQVRDLAFRPVEMRLADTVLEYGQLFGELGARGTRIAPRLNQSRLALSLGVSRRSVHQIISRWISEGLLAREAGGRYAIVAPERLAARGSGPKAVKRRPRNKK
jgi:CRP/FNR family transcriptional regulator, cyclic AMP receptor protein